MIKKKNAIFTFLFSLVPGAGEMYMGFMKQGVSLMSVFFVCLAICTWMRADVLVFAGIIVWCYSFFHVHNLRSLPDAEFQKIEDKIIVPFNGVDLDFHITNNKLRAVGAVVMILFGASLLWNYVLDVISWILPYEIYDIVWRFCYDLPEAIVAVVIIWLGVRLIKGKKKALETQAAEPIVQSAEQITGSSETIAKDTEPNT